MITSAKVDRISYFFTVKFRKDLQ